MSDTPTPDEYVDALDHIMRELFWANFKPGDDVEFVEVTSDHAQTDEIENENS